MDSISIEFYQLHFKSAFLEKKGLEFQNWFWDIMDACHPGDFLRVRPWGNQGDQKNDGYLKSNRLLFACYAPNEIAEAATLKKIDGDFKGALPHWKAWFDQWIFVHNSKDGLSPKVTKKLLTLRKKHAPLLVDNWGFAELRSKLFDKPDSKVFLQLFGAAPTAIDLDRLGFDDLKPVLTAIQRSPVSENQDVKVVPPDKLLANNLSSEVQDLLNAGSVRTSVVAQFFSTYYDPNIGEELAQRFRQEYQSLRKQGKDGDELFFALQTFAGGKAVGTPQHQVAVLTVLAYFFERCEIFEPAPAGAKA